MADDLDYDSEEELIPLQPKRQNLRPFIGQKKPRNVDEALELVGGIGYYQNKLLLIMSVLGLMGKDVIGIIFFAAKQDHWCHVKDLEGLTEERQKYIAIPFTSDGEYSQCEMYALNYSSYSDKDFAAWNRSTMIGDLTPRRSCVEGWDYSSRELNNTVTKRLDLVCGSSWKVPMITFIFLLGLMIGTSVLGWVADSWGRKKSMYLCIVMKIVASFMLVYPVNFIWELFFRFIQGAAHFGCHYIAFIMIVEQSGKEWRTFLGIGLNILSTLGFIKWPLMAYYIRDDVTLQLVHAIPQVLFFSYWWLMDETPRWLLSKGRWHEAVSVIRKIAVANGREPPTIDFLSDMNETAHSDEDVVDRGYVDLFKNRTLAGRTVVLSFYGFASNLLYYAFSLNMGGLAGSLYLNTALSGVVEIPINFASIWLINWKYTGRKLTLALANIFCGLLCFAAIYTLLHHITSVFVTFFMFSKMFTTISTSAIMLYVSEIYPTDLRGKAMSFTSTCGRMGAILVPYVGEPLAALWPPLPQIVYAVLGLISGMMMLPLKETLNSPLATNQDLGEIYKSTRDRRTYTHSMTL